MRSVPHVLRGAFRMALRVACQEILDGMEANSEARTVRGWKFFMVLPRMLLFRPLRGGVVSRNKLESRVRQFQEGDWISLLRESVSCADVAHSSVVRRRRRRGPDEESARASRALSLVHMGELSAARQALEGASVAPGNLATLGMLTDPTGRPPVPRGSQPGGAGCAACGTFHLGPTAAAGPSGMTSGVILAYMCVKLLVRSYVCHRVGPFWVHFGSILGPFWVHFGSILGPFWVHFGSILGPCWVHVGSMLGPFWVHFGSILGPFWVHSAYCLNVDAS